jgi:two-component system, NarL family, nitrate/nitrite response regulator NarL
MVSRHISLEMLTDREREVLRMIADGATSKEIGFRLKISYKTVDAHRENIKKKLQVNSIAHLVRYAIALGLVTPEFIQEDKKEQRKAVGF